MGSSRKSPSPSNATQLVIDRFERALEGILARVVVSADDAIAVAYSGGLDSSLLLELAARYCHRRGRALHVFHIHHGLSPNADDWRAHCERQALALGAHFDAINITVQDPKQLGIEQAARMARYDALGQLCRRHKVRLLLTAHHQDDQAETVLLQLFRGTGLRGLGGMADTHDAHALLGEGLALGRPLLECSRDELEQAAKVMDVAHIVDESNEDTRYRRNAVRHEIAPVVEQFFPAFASTIARSSQHWQAAQRLLDDLAELDEAQCAEGDALRLDRLSQLSADRADNLLRYWLAGQGALQPPSAAQLSQLRTQVLHARAETHPSLQLCGLLLQRHGGLLIADIPKAGEPPHQDISIQWRGEREIEVPEWQGSLLFDTGADKGVCPLRLQVWPMLLRARSGGERLKPDPLRPSRTLKNLFQESALPAQQRPWLPLAYVSGALVFAAGLGMDVREADAAGGVRFSWRPF
jgi:tRNA(Ile)-lysidine synthase